MSEFTQLSERQIDAQLAAHLKERNKYRDPMDLLYGYTLPLQNAHDPDFEPDYFQSK